MFKIGIFLFALGIGLLWIGAKQSSQELRKIGLGLLVAGAVLGAVSFLNIDVLPS